MLQTISERVLGEIQCNVANLVWVDFDIAGDGFVIFPVSEAVNEF